MAQKSGFFNSVNGDRRYRAEFFSEYFASFIGNGVFPNPSNNLQILSNNNMTVSLKAGKAWINGHIYINEDDLILNLDHADGVLKRIDRIVIQFNTLERTIKAVIKKGEFATNPIPKNIQRDADCFELAIADIFINAGSINISQSDITDLRLNNNYCGIVHGTVNQVDTTTLFNQYQTWLREKRQEYNIALSNWIQLKQNSFESWYETTKTNEQKQIDDMQETFQKDWETWFNWAKAQFKDDPVGEILERITTVNETLEEYQKNINSAVQKADEAIKTANNKEPKFNKNSGFNKNKSDSVASTDSNTLATSKAVKTAYDKAVSAINVANNKEPKFNKNSGFNKNKSDSIASTDSNTIATSKAVKTAYDRGTTALNKADSAYSKAEQAFISASNGKKAIANAITGVGIPANANETFNSLANKINELENLGSLMPGPYISSYVNSYGNNTTQSRSAVFLKDVSDENTKAKLHPSTAILYQNTRENTNLSNKGSGTWIKYIESEKKWQTLNFISNGLVIPPGDMFYLIDYVHLGNSYENHFIVTCYKKSTAQYIWRKKYNYEETNNKLHPDLETVKGLYFTFGFDNSNNLYFTFKNTGYNRPYKVAKITPNGTFSLIKELTDINKNYSELAYFMQFTFGWTFSNGNMIVPYKNYTNALFKPNLNKIMEIRLPKAVVAPTAIPLTPQAAGVYYIRRFMMGMNRDKLLHPCFARITTQRNGDFIPYSVSTPTSRLLEIGNTYRYAIPINENKCFLYSSSNTNYEIRDINNVLNVETHECKGKIIPMDVLGENTSQIVGISADLKRFFIDMNKPNQNIFMGITDKKCHIKN